MHTKFWLKSPEGKETFGSHRHRWENNIKMDFKETECEAVHWIQLALDTFQCQVLVNMVMRLCVS
jgi:hypothetical protein